MSLQEQSVRIIYQSRFLKWNSNIITPFLTDCFNQKIKNSTFPNELKNSGIYPICKIFCVRTFRAKIGSLYSPYLDLLVGFPQGSILGPFLF